MPRERGAVAAVLAAGLGAFLAWGGPIPPIVFVALALAGFGFITGLQLVGPPGVATGCLTAAAFFAPLSGWRYGPVEVSEPFLLAAAGAILIGDVRPRSRTGWPGNALLFGLSMMALGGLLGARFRPPGPVFSVALSYQGSALGPIPEFIADVLRFGLGTILVVVIFWAWQPTRAQVRTATLAYVLGAGLSGFDGFLGPSLYGRTDGFSTHPVPFGLSCALGAVIAIGLTLDTRGLTRAAALVGGAGCAAGVLASGTRGALLVVVIGVLLFQIGLRSSRSLAAPLAIGLVVVLLGLVAPNLVGGSNTVARVGGGDLASISDDARARVRNESFELVRTHGITGAGFEFLDGPHNLLLGVVAAAGVVGFVGLLLVIGSHLGALSRSRGDPMAAAIAAAVLAMYLPFWVVNPGWDRWLWVPIGLLYTSVIVEGVRPTPARPAGAPGVPTLGE